MFRKEQLGFERQLNNGPLRFLLLSLILISAVIPSVAGQRQRRGRI